MPILNDISNTFPALDSLNAAARAPKKTKIGDNSKLTPVRDAIAAAVKNCVAALIAHQDKFSNGDSEITDVIEQFYQKIRPLPESEKKDEIKQQFRFLLLVLYNRKDKFATPAEEANFLRVYNVITTEIGCVPRLNDDVCPIKLPDDEFLPPGFFVPWGSERLLTPQRWADIMWENPSRDSSNEGINFFSKTITDDEGEKHSIASARLYLINQDGCEGAEGNEALSFSDLDYCPIGDLVADHLQPSADLIDRQAELIEAMNIDPIFRIEMERINSGQRYSYFIKVDDVSAIDQKKITGSKWYYMRYHNCVDNLWFITPKHNSGTGKSNEDPIVWLKKSSAFGDEFLRHIGGESNINKRGIFYTVDNKPLAKVAHDWFIQHYRQEISAAGYMRSRVRAPLREQFEILAKGSKKEKLNSLVRFGLVGAFARKAQDSPASSPRASQGSYASGDVEMSAQNLGRLERAMEKNKDAITAVRREVRGDFVKMAQEEKRGKMTVPHVGSDTPADTVTSVPFGTTALLMGRFSPIIQDDYWYTSEDIQLLLRQKITADAANVLAAQFPFLKGVKQAAREHFQEAILAAVTGDMPSVMPLNLVKYAKLDVHGLPSSGNTGKGHWVGIVIFPNPLNQKCPTVKYIDSLGNGEDTDQDISQDDVVDLGARHQSDAYQGMWEDIGEVVELLRDVQLPSGEQLEPAIVVTGLCQQENGSDCGAFMVENLVSEINQTTRSIPADKSAQAIRQHHAQILAREQVSITGESVSPDEPLPITSGSAPLPRSVEHVEGGEVRKRKLEDEELKTPDNDGGVETSEPVPGSTGLAKKSKIEPLSRALPLPDGTVQP